MSLRSRTRRSEREARVYLAFITLFSLREAAGIFIDTDWRRDPVY